MIADVIDAILFLAKWWAVGAGAFILAACIYVTVSRLGGWLERRSQERFDRQRQERLARRAVRRRALEFEEEQRRHTEIRCYRGRVVRR